LDYKNPHEFGGYQILSSLSHTSQIDDMNEIKCIWIEGDGFESIVNAMPKSYKWSFCKISDGKTIRNAANINFNTFFMNNTTGSNNETAIKRRIKVIEKLSKLGL
jgi:hypothetical protein